MTMRTMLKTRLCFAILLASLSCAASCPQESPPLTPNRLAVARDFVRTFYPNLNNKNYFLSLQTSLYYDKSSDPFAGLLVLNIGEGPKGDVTPGNVVPKCPPGAVPIQKVPSGGFVGGGCLNPSTTSEQFLSAGFHFDENGHLVWFTAEGPATSNATAKIAFGKAVGAGKVLMGAQLVAAFKHTGAKYGPDDKEEFVKTLPTMQLANFLGTLNVTSVRFAPYLESDRSNFSDEMRWEVRAVAKRTDGTSATYRMEFEQYDGNLVSLCDTSTYPCNIWEPVNKDKR